MLYDGSIQYALARDEVGDLRLLLLYEDGSVLELTPDDEDMSRGEGLYDEDWNPVEKSGFDFNEFEEEEHPRAPKGDPKGGQFVVKPRPGDSAVEALRKAGLNIIKVSDIPQMIRDAAGIKEPGTITPPQELAGQAMADAFNQVKASGSAVGELLKSGPQISFAYAGYEPKGANMSTARFGRRPNDSKHYMMINTAFEPTMPGTFQPASYSARASTRIYEETRDLEKAYYEENRIAAWHEIGHYIDNITGDEFSHGFLQALQDHFKDDFEATEDFLTRELSYYALSSLREASAEAGSRYLAEGQLPEPLSAWGKRWFG